MDKFDFYKTVCVSVTYDFNGCIDEIDYIVPLYFDDKTCMTVDFLYKVLSGWVEKNNPGSKVISINIFVRNDDINFSK